MSISDTTRNVKEQTGAMVEDIASEVKHEAHNIRYVKEPVDPTQSDHVVRRHVNGLAISFFVIIVLFLAAVIGGVALYQRAHHAPQTPTAPASSLTVERMDAVA